MTTPLEARLTEENEALRAENKLLREKIDLLVRRVFGKSSEQLDAAQLTLMLQDGDEVPKKDPASGSDVTGLEAELARGEKELKRTTKPRNERRLRIPEHLPVSETIVIEPDEVKADPGAWRKMGELITEQLDYQTGKFTRRLIVRPKYVRIEQPCEAPVIAALPTLQDKGIAAPGLMAQVIVSKYCDHLPLYRQEQIYRLRHGIELPRQTLARWIEQAAQWLRPIYERIHTGVLDGGYVQADETAIEYLKPGNGQTKCGYFWTLKRPGHDALFVWSTSRAAGNISAIVPRSFHGIIGSDGYSAYQNHAAQSNGRITLAACWAHARRKFDEAKAGSPRAAAQVLRLIQQLYRIEKTLRESKASPKLRAVARQQQSQPIVQRIGSLLRTWKRKQRHLPQSLMGKAIDYTLHLWPHLQVYLHSGQVEIDNNMVENAIRPTAIGKKNWLFIGEAEAGQRSAILYTLIEACRHRSIDPWDYLRDVLTRLPSMTNQQINEVTPDAWAEARSNRRTSLQPRPAQQSQATA